MPNRLSADWTIEHASDHPVARFAAEELRRTLQRLGGPALPVLPAASSPRLRLHHGPSGDGFSRTPDPNGLTLAGEGPRGLLYAVYDLLESLGCRWVSPDAAGEHIPRDDYVTLPGESVSQQPALAGRCLIIGHDFFLAEAEAWIVWAGRNRLNTIFVHTIDERLALGACHLKQWRARRKQLLPLLRERGMTLELGGHGLSALVPRHHFSTSPEAFRFDGTRRTPRFNFCPSSPVALGLLREHGAAYFHKHPEADIYHLWPDDILGGGWCQCPACAHMSPSDQALLATNALAETLAEINPQARLAYLAYHDTEAPPGMVRPRPNVVLCYAPRPRSYAHGIADAASPVNGPFWEHLRGNLAVFEQKLETGDRRPETGDRRPETGDRDPAQITQYPSASRFVSLSNGRAGAVRGTNTFGSSFSTHRSAFDRVFEYYLDGILFKTALPPLPHVIRDDMRAYQAAGVHTVQALMTGDRPWLSPPLNAYLFARLAWNPEQEPETLLECFAAVRAPRTPAALAQAYRSLAAAWHPALAFGPAEMGQRLEDELVQKLSPFSLRRRLKLLNRQLPLPNLRNPPLDVLDYMGAPRLSREQRLEALSAVEPLLAEGRAAWREVLAQAHADAAHLEQERNEWEAGALLLHFFHLRQQLFVLAGRSAAPTTLRAARAETQAALDALRTWGDAHLPPGRVRANFNLLLMQRQLPLDALWARRLAWPWQRPLRRLRTYATLSRLTLRLLK
ncbi:MAG: DUF4838 domain-containing protein [Chloroflexaceae bacterium]|nr:DUF4838 domain-containing protein [Chloroflexaceae bacterium]